MRRRRVSRRHGRPRVPARALQRVRRGDARLQAGRPRGRVPWPGASLSLRPVRLREHAARRRAGGPPGGVPGGARDMLPVLAAAAALRARAASRARSPGARGHRLSALSAAADPRLRRLCGAPAPGGPQRDAARCRCRHARRQPAPHRRLAPALTALTPGRVHPRTHLPNAQPRPHRLLVLAQRRGCLRQARPLLRVARRQRWSSSSAGSERPARQPQPSTDPDHPASQLSIHTADNDNDGNSNSSSRNSDPPGGGGGSSRSWAAESAG